MPQSALFDSTNSQGSAVAEVDRLDLLNLNGCNCLFDSYSFSQSFIHSFIGFWLVKRNDDDGGDST